MTEAQLPSANPPFSLKKSLALMESYTWFAPAWAFLVGAVASHAVYFNVAEDAGRSLLSIGRLAIGIGMAGPLLTGFSQVINDWYDRDIDAINQPERLIPSGKVSRRQVMWTIIVLAVLSMAVALFLGLPVAGLAAFGIVVAVLYSIPQVKLKRNGWVGNAAVGLAYEGLPWMAGHLAFAPLTTESLLLALIFSFGSHGIMTINDFKSVAGDRAMGIRSIPALYGERNAAKIAAGFINAAQIMAVVMLLAWGKPIAAGAVLLFMIGQWRSQYQLVNTPTQPMAVRYNIVAIPLYVWGMLAAAIGLG